MTLTGRTSRPSGATNHSRTTRALAASALLRWGVGTLGIVAALVIWEVTVSANSLPKVVLPTPVDVLRRLLTMFGSGDFWRNVGVSLAEFAWGFVIGTVLGIVVGMVMGESRRAQMILHPVVEILRFVVPFAWIPLTVLWFGTSMSGKFFLVGYAVFSIMVISTAAMIRDVDETLTRVGVMLGMGRASLAFRVRLRAAAPGVASAARAAAAIGWIAVVAAEYIGSNAGVGFLIINAQQTLATDVIISGMIVIGLIGAALSFTINMMSRFFLNYTRS